MIARRRLRAVPGLLAAVAFVSLSLASNAMADSPAPGGAFVIGDSSAVRGASVTFWGAQWWQDNALTGGDAPAAFKGYADTATASCNQKAWSTRPGNSSEPPAQVGDVITVVVASHIDKSGPVISGDTSAIATIRVDPGYGPNPGHPGTGTVLGVVSCNGGGISYT